jgi:hypothetical protein
MSTRGSWAVGGDHPKRRNHHRIIVQVTSLKNLPGIGEPNVQRNHVATDVIVLLPDTAMCHLLGGRSGSTTRPWFLTSLRDPEGSTSQCQPGGAQSRTWRLSNWLSPPSRRRGCRPGMVVGKKFLTKTNSYARIFILLCYSYLINYARINSYENKFLYRASSRTWRVAGVVGGTPHRRSSGTPPAIVGDSSPAIVGDSSLVSNDRFHGLKMVLLH